MKPSPTLGDPSSAVDFILQPLVLESLQAVSEGTALQDALPADTDMVVLDAALQRLVTVGAIRLSETGPFGRHTLTERGKLLFKLLEELEAVSLRLAGRQPA